MRCMAMYECSRNEMKVALLKGTHGYRGMTSYGCGARRGPDQQPPHYVGKASCFRLLSVPNPVSMLSMAA
jgi:hypothetical protein